MSSADASTSSTESSDIQNQQTLSVELPTGIKSGEIITIQGPENTYFEAVVPDEATAGDTLSILVRNRSISQEDCNNSNSASASSDSESNSATTNHKPKSLTQQTMEATISSIYVRVAKLDADYKISQKAEELDKKMEITSTAQKIDAKYELRNKATSILSPIYRKAQELNEEHKITERVYAGVITAEKAVISAGRNFLVFAREVEYNVTESASSTAVVLKGKFSAASAYTIQTATNLVKSVEEETGKVYSSTHTFATTAITNTKATVTGAIAAGTETAQKVINTTAATVTAGYETARSTTTAYVATAKDTANTAVNTTKATVTGYVATAKDSANTAVNTVTGYVATAKDTAHAAVNTTKATVTGLVSSGIIIGTDAAQKAVNTTAATVTGIISSIQNAVRPNSVESASQISESSISIAIAETELADPHSNCDVKGDDGNLWTNGSER